MKNQLPTSVQESLFLCSVWTLGLVALIASLGRADSGVPSAYHYAVLDREGDCSVYRALKTKAESKRSELEQLAQQTKKLAVERREILEKCGASRGISAVLRSEEEQLVSLCQDEYVRWMDSGTSLMVLATDLQDLSSQEQKLNQLARYHCLNR